MNKNKRSKEKRKKERGEKKEKINFFFLYTAFVIEFHRAS
jgi:hypothetical protein